MAKVELSKEIEGMKGNRKAETCLETFERWFWKHVEYQMEVTGETEQEVLDAIKVPGYTNRRARKKGA